MAEPEIQHKQFKFKNITINNIYFLSNGKFILNKEMPVEWNPFET